MRLEALLGYHMPGTHHYVTALREGNAFLGQGRDLYVTSDAFIALVTAVHEHYHLMQELLQGFFWWRQDALDRFTRAATEAARAGGERIPQLEMPDHLTPQLTLDADPRSFARAWWFELANIDRNMVSPVLTRRLLEAEVEQASAATATMFSPEAFELTTLDLIECHAALLTELYVSKLIADRPEKFHRRVVADLEPLFRVARMPDRYRRPLHVLLHMLEAGKMKFQLAPDHHPMYDGIEHGSVYLLLAFLLDYALHLPPDPLLMFSTVRDAPALQDIHAPMRFINLAFLWLNLCTSGASETKRAITSEAGLYSDAAPLLAAEVNRMHAHVRAPGVPMTFFELRETTRRWKEKFDDPPFEEWFPLYEGVRRASWRERDENATVWFDLEPLQFDLRIRLPRFVIVGNALMPLPYLAVEESLSDAEVQAQMAEMVRPYLEALILGQWQKRDDLPATIYPMRYIEEMLAREMVCDLAKSILFTGTMSCPLTNQLGAFVPCTPRMRTCEQVRDLRSLPRDGCALRAAASRFGGADRYHT